MWTPVTSGPLKGGQSALRGWTAIRFQDQTCCPSPVGGTKVKLLTLPSLAVRIPERPWRWYLMPCQASVWAKVFVATTVRLYDLYATVDGAFKVLGSSWLYVHPFKALCEATSLLCATQGTPAHTLKGAWLARLSSALASWEAAWFWSLDIPSAEPSMELRRPSWMLRMLRSERQDRPLEGFAARPWLCGWTSCTGGWARR